MAKASYKNVEFTIKPDGTTEMDLQGFEGKGCHEVAEQFEKLLGKSSKVEKKREYHRDNKVRVQQKR
jgi:hypothetical protein